MKELKSIVHIQQILISTELHQYIFVRQRTKKNSTSNDSKTQKKIILTNTIAKWRSIGDLILSAIIFYTAEYFTVIPICFQTISSIFYILKFWLYGFMVDFKNFHGHLKLKY